MIVKEGFLTLLYLTLDMKNATWIWSPICDQGKHEFWSSVVIAHVIQFKQKGSLFENRMVARPQTRPQDVCPELQNFVLTNFALFF